MSELSPEERLALLRARRGQADSPESGSTDEAAPSPVETGVGASPVQRSSVRGDGTSGSRRQIRLARRLPNKTRVTIGSLSGVGFVATGLAMGPLLVEPESTEVVTSGGDGDADVELNGLAMASSPSGTVEPRVVVHTNYIYVDAEGRPLSETEAAAALAQLNSSSPGSADTQPEQQAVPSPETTAPAPPSPTGAPAPAAPEPAAAPAPTAAPAPAAPPATAAPTAPPATAAPTAPPATAAPTTPPPPPTTAAPAPPPPPTTAAPAPPPPPKSGSSG